MLNSLSNSTVGLGAQHLVSWEAPRGQQSEASNPLIDQLSQLLARHNGQLDQSSPLGKMVADHMPGSDSSGSDRDRIKAALQSLLQDIEGNSQTGGSPGNTATGQQGLSSQALNGLAKTKLDGLSNQPSGTVFSQSDAPILSKVADFMDANPDHYAKPVSGSGSWRNELQAGNSLSGNDQNTFREALSTLGAKLGTDATGGVSDVRQGCSGSSVGQGAQLSAMDGMPGTSGPTGAGSTGAENATGGAADEPQAPSNSTGASQAAMVAELRSLLNSMVTSSTDNDSDQQNNNARKTQAHHAGHHQLQSLDASATQAAQSIAQSMLQGSGMQAGNSLGSGSTQTGTLA